MRIIKRSIQTIFLTGILGAGFLTGGCAGPSTRVLPRETKAHHEPPKETAVLEEGNPFYLQEELEILAASPRAAGSEEEQQAVQYIQQMFADYGYETSLQRFKFQMNAEGDEAWGTNVVAVRQASDKNSDILVVAAHHDTVPASPGANESASGVAALLETARLLSHIPTDTELRFVSFSGHEAGHAGAGYYINSLPEKERQRMIGAIQLDALGYVLEEGIVLCTADAGPTLLGDTLSGVCQGVLEEEWPYEQQEEGTHSMFVRGRIPAVSVRQRREAYEKGSRFDRPQIVDMERVCQVVNVISQGISGIMSPDTPSMLAKSRHYNDLRDGAFIQSKDTPIYFGEDLFRTECRMGMTGVLVAENTDQQGNPFRVYQYLIKWFDVDQILLTDYYFTNGRLSSVIIDGDGAGVSPEEMEGRLTAVYGQPSGEGETPYGTEHFWTVPKYRMSVSLVPESEGYLLELKEFPTEAAEIGRYDVLYSSQERQLRLSQEPMEEADSRVRQMADMASRFLPLRSMGGVESIDIYTDGVGGTQNYLEVLPGENGAEEGHGGLNESELSFVWGLDLEDAMTIDGKWRNETETIRQMLMLYGRMLEQIGQGRYRDAFHAVFSQEGEEAGQDDSSAPEGADLIHQAMPGVKPGDYRELPPDFVTSFLWFVLSDGPEEDGEWGARIRFFYQFEELAAYRTQVRNNLNMSP